MLKPKSYPATTRALVIRSSKTQAKPTIYHDAVLEERSLAPLKPGQVLVKINAAAYNHRDLWIRKGMYPGIVLGSVFGADGAGTVSHSFDSGDSLIGTRVFLTPMRGWKDAPDAPELTERFGILGGGGNPPLGTFAHHVIVERDQVVPTPAHLDDIHAAAWPLAGLTAWRATMVNAGVKLGSIILITGIGGGVAITALQLCVAQGASVYVTSGSQTKLDEAIKLGAKGGVNYRDKNWHVQLASLLTKYNPGSQLDAVIDSGGGEIMAKVSGILKMGGKVVVYGMTAAPKITFTMREVLRHHQIIGSTMGSHADLINATNFIAQHRIIPVVSHVLPGLASGDDGFELMKSGGQFGKIVVQMDHGDTLSARL